MDSAAPSTLEQALDLVHRHRQVIQIRIVNLGHAAGYEKIQHARLVTAAAIELIEAQGALDAQLVAAIGELRAINQAEASTHGA